MWLESGAFGRAMVPSGASTGKREAMELRDGDSSRYLGKGVRRAVQNVIETIAPEIEGMEAGEQAAVDRALLDLDGTPNKSGLGANAILGVSLAVARAAADDSGLPLYQYLGGPGARILPVPFMNVLNGGAHADNGLDIQEFMLVPTGAGSLRGGAPDRGGDLPHPAQAAQGPGAVHRGGRRGRLRADPAAATWRRSTSCCAPSSAPATAPAKTCSSRWTWRRASSASTAAIASAPTGPQKSSEEMIAFYEDLCGRYPICSIEDGLGEDDWEGWRQLTRRLGDRVQLVGDDLFVTNPAILQKGIQEGLANAILVKVNQIGTLTETLEAIELAKRAGYGTVISHRSGETEDSFVADLAVAVNGGQIKTGSLARGERTAKYNQLLRIEEELGVAAVWPGRAALRGGRR